MEVSESNLRTEAFSMVDRRRGKLPSELAKMPGTLEEYSTSIK